MAKEKTVPEMREEFLAHVRSIVGWWNRPDLKHTQTERLEGVAFSIMVLLDGGSGMHPACTVVPTPHPEDREFLEGKGKDWYPEPKLGNDIAGVLHELLVQ